MTKKLILSIIFVLIVGVMVVGVGYAVKYSNSTPTTGSVSEDTSTDNLSEEKIKELTLELESSAVKIKELNSQIEDLNVEIEEIITNNNEEISELEVQIQLLNENNERLTNEYNAQIADLDSQIEQLEENSKISDVEHAEEIAELESQKQELQNTIELLNTQHSEEVESLQSQIDELQYTNNSYLEQIALLESQVAEETSKFEDKKNELAILQQSYDELQSDYNELEKEFSSSLLGNDTLMGLYNGSVTELVVPEGITTIRSYAFAGLTLDKLTLPSTITSIGSSAFVSTKLNDGLDINVSGDLTLGYQVFNSSSEGSIFGDVNIVCGGILECSNLSLYTSGNFSLSCNKFKFSSGSFKIYCQDLDVIINTVPPDPKMNLYPRGSANIKLNNVNSNLSSGIYPKSGEFRFEISPLKNIDFSGFLSNIGSDCTGVTIVNTSDTYNITVSPYYTGIIGGSGEYLKSLELIGKINIAKPVLGNNISSIDRLILHEEISINITSTTYGGSKIKSLIYDGITYKADLYKIIDSNLTSLYVTDALYDQYIADENYSAYADKIYKISELDATTTE